MLYEVYPHRYADIILNSDYELKKEIEEIIKSIDFESACREFESQNENRKQHKKRPLVGKQLIINAMFRKEFEQRGWELEKNIFNDPENDLVIDFWKRDVGLDVAFNHRSFIGGDLLRFQAAAEVRNIIKVGVYICPSREFARKVSPDGASMVSFERTQWFLENFYAVLTVPIFLIGLTGSSLT
jgi:hypothetical protein